MSGSLNKVQIIGHLGRDPETKSFQNGGKVANIRVATSESWKDKQSGEKRERTEWHSVVIYSEGIIGVVERFLRKGSKVYVEGQLQTRKWQDSGGNDRYSTEIVLQGFNAKLLLLTDGGRDRSGSDQQGGSDGGWQGGPADLDDDVPF